MSRANDMAFPAPQSDTPNNTIQCGLTIREHFAAMAMQAILTGAVTRGCPAHEWTDQEMSVRVADSLLAELAKERT